MATSTINPYSGLSTQFTDNITGLDTIATAGANNINLINTTVVSKFVPVYFPTGTSNQDLFNANKELAAVLPFVENGFINGDLRNPSTRNLYFSDHQLNFINNLLNGVYDVPVQSISDFILDVEDNISKSGLSADEQSPLLMATMIGVAANNYWLSKIETPGWWATYFDQTTPPLGGSTNAYNRMNVPYWVSSAMEGALLGYSVSNQMDPYRIIASKLLTSISGAVAVNAAKVIVKIIPRVQPLGININKTVLSNMPGNDLMAIPWWKSWFKHCKTEGNLKTECVPCDDKQTSMVRVLCTTDETSPKCRTIM